MDTKDRLLQKDFIRGDSPCVSRVLKYPKKCLGDFAKFFMSTYFMRGFQKYERN